MTIITGTVALTCFVILTLYVVLRIWMFQNRAALSRRGYSLK